MEHDTIALLVHSCTITDRKYHLLACHCSRISLHIYICVCVYMQFPSVYPRCEYVGWIRAAALPVAPVTAPLSAGWRWLRMTGSQMPFHLHRFLNAHARFRQYGNGTRHLRPGRPSAGATALRDGAVTRFTLGNFYLIGIHAVRAGGKRCGRVSSYLKVLFLLDSNWNG